MTAVELGFRQPIGRRGFIGGSDARIIMGNDEAALVRLWREKRGEAEPGTCPATSSSSSGS
jgi:predicted phage-related endonuclease